MRRIANLQMTYLAVSFLVIEGPGLTTSAGVVNDSQSEPTVDKSCDAYAFGATCRLLGK